MSKGNEETVLPEGQVFIDPRVNPAAAAYHAGLVARQQAKKVPSPMKYGVPVGGAPMPHIPRLDRVAADGTTMAAQAEATGPTTTEMLQAQPRASGSIVERPIPMQQAATPQFLPGDMLPPEAQNDPHFQAGAGSMFAVTQPHLAMKYGVIRNGQHVHPGSQRQGKAGQGLSPETVAGLQALEELKQRQAAPAAAPAGTKVETESPKAAEDKKAVEEAIGALDSFDYDALRRMMNRDMLNNPDQKEIIEARLKPLDIDELIMKNRVSQEIVVVPGKFWFRFSSMTGEEDLALKQLIMEESKSTEVTDRYLLDKFAFMALTLGTTHINGNPVPSHTDEKGEFDKERFWVKFNWMVKRSVHMLACIGVNHTWFEQRVRGCFVAKKLGNG
jgi:hypothetical protein